jgi:hypothetical protein
MQTVMERTQAHISPFARQGERAGLHDELDHDMRAFLKLLVIALAAFAVAVALSAGF